MFAALPASWLKQGSEAHFGASTAARRAGDVVMMRPAQLKAGRTQMGIDLTRTGARPSRHQRRPATPWQTSQGNGAFMRQKISQNPGAQTSTGNLHWHGIRTRRTRM